MKIKVQKSLAPNLTSQILVPIFAVLASLFFCAIFFALTGKDPIEVYSAMFSGALGSEYGISETFVKMIPLALCGLGVAVAFRMHLWNIGAEGQFYMGACAATWVTLSFPTLPFFLMIPAMIIMGALAGGLWGLLAGWFKVKWQVDEIISTLMMNYIGILWVDFLVYGAWRDPEGKNFPLTAAFPAAAMLPTFGSLRVHYGIFFVFILALIFWVVFKKSKWGYETLVIGSNPIAAKYAGINIRSNVLLAMFISGALCGIAGMVEVSGVVGKLQPGISPGYGYTAIIVAWLARLHPLAIVGVAFLFAVIHVGGFMLQTMGMPSATATMLQGAMLFFVVGSDILTKYEIKFISSKEGEKNE
ncbi:MAG: ABC transporter permease [Acidaminococcaceae bacterium]|nr:ABC transporter permease [Acidaminococcaceae bacterium]